jgi:hypothetical protein
MSDPCNTSTPDRAGVNRQKRTNYLPDIGGKRAHRFYQQVLDHKDDIP